MLNMSTQDPLSLPPKTIAEQVLEQLEREGKSRWILVEYKPVEISATGSLVINPEIFMPITNYKKLKKDLSNYQAQIWHPRKVFSVPCHFRIKTYKVHNINPNEPGIRVVRFTVKESKLPDVHVKRFVEIEMLPVTKDHEPKYKLIVLRAYGKLIINSLARCKVALNCECKQITRHIVIKDCNESATGAHWYDWCVILMSRNERLFVKWHWHGAKRLVKDVSYEL